MGYSPWGCKELDMTERMDKIERRWFLLLLVVSLMFPFERVTPFPHKTRIKLLLI